MGCCGKTYQPTVAPTPPEGWVLLEYTGSAIEPISFHSHVSGNNYRAGQFHNSRVDYRFVHVDPMDVNYLTGRGFKLAPVAEPEPEPIVEPDPIVEVALVDDLDPDPIAESEPEAKTKRGKK